MGNTHRMVPCLLGPLPHAARPCRPLSPAGRGTSACPRDQAPPPTAAESPAIGQEGTRDRGLATSRDSFPDARPERSAWATHLHSVVLFVGTIHDGDPLSVHLMACTHTHTHRHARSVLVSMSTRRHTVIGEPGHKVGTPSWHTCASTLSLNPVSGVAIPCALAKRMECQPSARKKHTPS